MNVNENALEKLRARVTEGMSPKRATHTLEVEKMAARLAEIYCPEKEFTLRAAALLHDVTKEYKTDAQVKLCEKYGIELTETDRFAPKTLHARTAAAIIPDIFSEFAEEEIISAVRWHTTGRAGMTLCEKLIYLADYIDMSRIFEDCVRLREFFFRADISNMNREELMLHLDRTMLLSYDMTVIGLITDGSPISEDTVRARNEVAISLVRRRAD